MLFLLFFFFADCSLYASSVIPNENVENASEDEGFYIEFDGSFLPLLPSESNSDEDEAGETVDEQDEIKDFLLSRDCIKDAVDKGWLRKYVLLKNAELSNHPKNINSDPKSENNDQSEK